MITGDKICGIHNDGEVDIYLIIGVAFVVKFFGDVSDQNCLRFEFREKGVEDAVIDTGKPLTNFRAVKYVMEFPNNRLAYKE